MKKFISLILSLTIMCSFIIPTYAEDVISVTLDGTPVQFDVLPQIINDRTMVPMRAIFETLGATVSWDDSTKTVTAQKDSMTISTTIGNNKIKVNSEEKIIDTAPIIIDGRTLVPVRFVSESLGYSVDWNASTKTVIISSLLEVHFIDVGQADSALILSGNSAMLVDGGNKEDGELVLKYLKQENVDYLDYIICTHGHEDHVGGLPYVLKNIKVGTIIVDDNYDTNIFNSFLDIANQKNINVIDSEAGHSFSLGGANIEILAPLKENYSDYNDNSIVFRIDHNESSFMFTGDAGVASEMDILNSGANVDSDVLKVGHHGSSTASSLNFLNAVSPEYAIISCGEGNSYGHPHRETVAALNFKNIETYRTDISGHITAVSDGKTITFSTNDTIVEIPTTQVQGSYIGNKNSKKLHLPSCSSLPAEKNRVYFDNINDAFKDGYSACSNCNPS